MPPELPTPSHEQAWALIRHINDCWTGDKLQELGADLHPEIVMVLPGFQGRIVGRDAIVGSFDEFCSSATLIDFKESDASVDVAGDTAVVGYVFEIVYERSGSTYQSSGRELWVLAREDGSWRAIWRTMLDLAEEELTVH